MKFIFTLIEFKCMIFPYYTVYHSRDTAKKKLENSANFLGNETD